MWALMKEFKQRCNIQFEWKKKIQLVFQEQIEVDKRIGGQEFIRTIQVKLHGILVAVEMQRSGMVLKYRFFDFFFFF